MNNKYWMSKRDDFQLFVLSNDYLKNKQTNKTKQNKQTNKQTNKILDELSGINLYLHLLV